MGLGSSIPFNGNLETYLPNRGWCSIYDWWSALENWFCWKRMECRSNYYIWKIGGRRMGNDWRNKHNHRWHRNVHSTLVNKILKFLLSMYFHCTIETNNLVWYWLRVFFHLDTVYHHGQEPVVKFAIDSSKINRWWPNGYGEQNLYTLHASFLNVFPEHFVSIQRKVSFR